MASQSFVSNASNTKASFDLTSGTTIAASANQSTLAISYDAATQSYTVTTGASEMQTFGPADKVSPSIRGETQFSKPGDSSRSHLTIVTIPYLTQQPNRFVALGYWQRDQLSSQRQDLSLDIFTFGLTTAAAAVPRIGTANYAIDVFGFLTNPTGRPVTLQATGTFDLDFGAGAFLARTDMRPFDTATGTNGYSGIFPLLLGGHIGSGGSFSGTASFRYLSVQLAGSSDGRFYGPNADELGATFSATSADGASLIGGFTGVLGTGGATQNLTLINITRAQELSAVYGEVFTSTNALGHTEVLTYTDASIVNLAVSGSMTYIPSGSPHRTAGFDPTNETAGPVNFTSYHTVVDGKPIDLSLYKPGDGNSELRLTYSSFGIWKQVGNDANSSDTYQQFFTYGIMTPTGATIRRTGSAHYAGIAYGAAIDPATLERYTLKGTSAFDVDFSSQNYSGNLALQSTPQGSATPRNIGQMSFSGALGTSGPESGALTQSGANVGQIALRFYGPNAEEVGASFTARANSLTMAGVAAALAQ
ncbi:MAG TPA: transferrin-binding protein-like solute binding protein [Sphingobium sp.]